jgi:hypothetical protein
VVAGRYADRRGDSCGGRGEEEEEERMVWERLGGFCVQNEARFSAPGLEGCSCIGDEPLPVEQRAKLGKDLPLGRYG